VAISLNHTIVPAYEPRKSAEFLGRILDAPVETFSHFETVRIGNLTLDYDRPRGDFTTSHYAFLVGEDEFDAIFKRVQDMGLNYYADPLYQQVGEINHRRGGRGFYFQDPNGHNFEVLTK